MMWTLFVALAVEIASAAPPPDTPAPIVSRCELGTTQRVSFIVDNPPQGSLAAVVRISLYGKNMTRLADEVVFAGTDAPILPVAGLLDSHAVTSVRCTYEGYVSSMRQGGIAEASSEPTGRKQCPKPDGLIVDGGPDAEVDTVVFGRGWIMARLGLEINHFFPDQETNFNGDVFAASIDGGPFQKVVVSGEEPQSISFLFTNLHPGLHQIDYGPWSAFDAVRGGSPGFSAGYHNLCVSI